MTKSKTSLKASVQKYTEAQEKMKKVLADLKKEREKEQEKRP